MSSSPTSLAGNWIVHLARPFSGQGKILVDESLAPIIKSLPPGAAVEVLRETELYLPSPFSGASAETHSLPGTIALALFDARGNRGNEALRRKFLLAYNRLREGGELRVVSHVRKGAKTHLKWMEDLFGNAVCLAREGNGARILSARRETGAAVPPEPPPERGFSATIGGRSLSFVTAAGLFSKERFDLGSRYLLETIPPLPKGRVLDLGCGYGAIGIALAVLYGDITVELRDKDPLAVEFASRNIARNGLRGRVSASLGDAADGLPPASFDFVVTHFPLHECEGTLARFVDGCADALSADGKLFGVALCAYPLLNVLRRRFARVGISRTTAEPEAYHIYEACSPIHRTP